MKNVKWIFMVLLICCSHKVFADIVVLDRGRVTAIALNVTGDGGLMVELQGEGSVCDQSVIVINHNDSAMYGYVKDDEMDKLFVLLSVAKMTGKRLSLESASGECHAITTTRLHAGLNDLPVPVIF